ncbi:sensor histidine kinase [Janthinobacterium agaricidamnosum]|uniref:histidine kinase n=1 Tax=Janthinobacterium agaricidamnosum NBRC 102515 = DSM 9628 TaxID=1349767 RepID=W0V2W6_9BURK|nr:ATP-binding protein [Janthinobacterium agaricidamnosum]CDG81612.1 HAMP domain protein [Janthinobacterium agaricidamnosum NBRC 102515 = DSM 9628]
MSWSGFKSGCAWGWRQVARPSLVRRLMVAQMLLLTLLWSLGTAFVMFDGGDNAAALNAFRIYDAVLSVAQNLADQPARQQQSLKAIDQALREDYEKGGVQALAPHLLVWQRGRLVYQSDGTPAGVRSAGPDGIETLYIKGQRWRVRSRQSADATIRVAMLAQADAWNFFVTINSRGYFLLPLLISLPFLLLPAWLSIRQALRPWSRVAQEVAARGPQDLTPLTFKPVHRELVPMVDSINALLLRVDQSAARERSFIADAAHELRTPLAAMRVNVEALQGQASEPRQRELLGGILSSGNRAARLVSQLLLLMRSDATDHGPQAPLALDLLLQDRLAALSGLAGRDDVELELEAQHQMAVLGQRESLVSLIDNLVENAIKYSPPRGVVTVSLRREGDWAVLGVADQGPGIAPALRQRVFDRFFRAPQQSQSGSGLGLAIAASVARQHGGAIELLAAPGASGLLARVRLPLAKAGA